MCFSTNGRHPYEYQLCSSSSRPVPFFVWGRLHTRHLKNNEKKLLITSILTKLEIKDTTNTTKSASCLDLHIEIDNEGLWARNFTTKSASCLDLHIEIDNEGLWARNFTTKEIISNFPILPFPFICSTIPAASVYGVYISQLMWYPSACGSYHGFLYRVLWLIRKILKQGFLAM